VTESQQEELWDALFLSTEQVEKLLTHIHEVPAVAWIYPMFAFAARTGARRSEMIRSEVDDIDFDGRTVRIREKKKDQGKEMTFRHVPLSNLLADAMRAWLAVHPGGKYTFCLEPGISLTVSSVGHQFVRATQNSKWKVLKGWHVLRHSFASNCAAAGVDQRLIDSWLGHQTDEMSQRYRHLFPSQEQAAINLVFDRQ
jgi:integrase